MRVCVIGLGYVGLPLAILAAKKGHSVTGYDVNKEKVDKVNKGISPIEDEYIEQNLKKDMIKSTTDPSVIKYANVVIICVPTPVDHNHVPDLSYVKSSSKTVSEYLQEKQLVIMESTVHPGTTKEIVKPILDKVRKKYYLAHCPERIDPGNKKWTVENIPRVVGGINKKSTKKVAEFYKSILNAEVVEVKSSTEAEATKIMENTFRDVNIAFINEMAKSFDKAGIDIMEVIKGASTKPFGFMPHYPGAGVGGHCIAVDPYYLINNAKTYDFDHEFLILARKINNSMPDYAVELLENEIEKLNEDKKGKVGVLGLSYKKNVDDDRESPSYQIINVLLKKGFEVLKYDPYLLNKSDVQSLEELFAKVDYLVLVTAHNEFKEMDLDLLKKHEIKIVIDGRNCLDKNKIEGFGIKHKGIGK